MSKYFAEINKPIIEEENFLDNSLFESLDDDDEVPKAIMGPEGDLLHFGSDITVAVDDDDDDDDDDLRIEAPEAIMGPEGDFLHFGSDITVIVDDDDGLDLDDDEQLLFKLTEIPEGVFLLDSDGNVFSGGNSIELTPDQLAEAKLFIPDLPPLPPDLPFPDLPDPLTFDLGVEALIVEVDDDEIEIEERAETNIEVTFEPVAGEEKSLSDIDPLMFNFTIEVPDIPPVLDIVLTQDLSGSFFDDLPQLQGDMGQYGQLYDALVDDAGLDAQFGIASFVDKPISPFGSASSGDFVYSTDLSVTGSRTDLINTVDSLTTFFGVDEPEAQLEALQQIGLRAEGEVGYRDQSGDPDDPQRFLVLSTDANFHVAGDFGSADPNNGDDVLDGTPPGTGEDYPFLQQVADALIAADITPIFSVTSGEIGTYQTLLQDLKDLGVEDGAVVELTSDSDNLADAILEALQEVTVDVEAVIAENTTGLDVVLEGVPVEDVDGPAELPFKVTASASDDYRTGQIVIEVTGGTIDGATEVTIEVTEEDIPVQTLMGTEGRDKLTGSNGPDKISALARADIINAGGGDDVVEAGLGSDQVTLGLGADTYVLDATLTNAEFFLGSDYIFDFAVEDQIELRGIDVNDLDVTNDGTNTFISADPDLGFIPQPLVTLANYTDPVTFVEV